MDFKIEIAKLLAAAAEISVEDAAAAVEIPAKKEMGDFAYPCFRLAKVFRKAPPMIAAELIEKIEKPAFIAKMQVVGAYINFLWTRVYTQSRCFLPFWSRRKAMARATWAQAKPL